MSETHSVKRHLDVEADAYDVQIRRFIPHYDDMLATGVELLGSLSGPEPRVVDLGGGTGALAAAVLKGLPRARVTVLDVDPEMLAVASERLALRRPRGLREASFLDSLPEADAVVASLALHHVHDLDRKTNLYREILSALTPDGAFLNLDAAVSDDPRVNRLIFDRWAAHLGEHGIPDAEARAHFAAWAEEDRYFPLDAESPPCAGPASPRSNASGAGGSAPSVAGCAWRRAVRYCGPRSRCVAPSKCGDQGCAEVVQASTDGCSHAASSSEPALMKAMSGSTAVTL